MTNTEKFILDNWKSTVRQNNEDGDGRDPLIGLPNEYTVPCISGMFQEMYYWDTYFTNVGLIESGLSDLARKNTENVAYLINRFGYMPNGNRISFLSRSQPPFFSKMVYDVYNVTKDKDWLSKMYSSIQTEYRFWQTDRNTKTGLNRYFCDWELVYKEFAPCFCDRIDLPKPKDEETEKEYAKGLLSVAESGWDCTSRFGTKTHWFNPVDLNSLLYALEKNMAFFAGELENGKQDLWNERANNRAELMEKLLWDDSIGMFCDYDFVNNKKGDLVSVAAFYPLFVGLATKEQAEKTSGLLYKLEGEFGIAGSENREDLLELQWDYPHSWACLNYIAYKGLNNYGYYDDANRVAEKFCLTIEKTFEKTGDLWEKYDVRTGDVSVTREYESPHMMGWTAGVYIYFKKHAVKK